MKVIFTREDKLIIEEFASAKLHDPCFEKCNHADRSACCGDCPDKVSYKNRYNSEIRKYEESFPESSPMRDFVNEYVYAYIEVSKLRKEFDNIKNKLEDAENKLKLFEEME